MNQDQNDRLDRALSQGDHFSVQEKEQMWEDIAQRAGVAEPDNGRASWLDLLRLKPLWIGCTVAACAGILFYSMGESGEATRVKGAGPVNAGQLELSTQCDRSDCGAPICCSRGANLKLAIEPLPLNGYAAVALLGQDGVLNWFYPDANGESAQLSPGRLTALGLQLPRQLEPGSHQLFVVVSQQAPTRALVKQQLELLLQGKAVESVQHSQQKLVVLP